MSLTGRVISPMLSVCYLEIVVRLQLINIKTHLSKGRRKLMGGMQN